MDVNVFKKRFVAAPMVDQSELAFRLLCRSHGVELCYTPMLHSSVFCREEVYRAASLLSTSQDQPLIVQFCANDSDVLLEAGKYIEEIGIGDGIDLNLGCPQTIAKRGRYGAFLQDEWTLISEMIGRCRSHLNIPISAKIRVFDDAARTLQYAEMIERAGAQQLTVHGRTREQKGISTGLADWNIIADVVKKLKIPVYANGNILTLNDVHQCLEFTGCQGVMSAEGILHNPALFEGRNPPVWDMCRSYLDLVDIYPCKLSFARGHIFKILYYPTLLYHDIRTQIAVARSTTELRAAIDALEIACQPDLELFKSNPSSFDLNGLVHPYWLCQAYTRNNSFVEVAAAKSVSTTPSRVLENQYRATFHDSLMKTLLNDFGLSKNKAKKVMRNPKKKFEGSSVTYVNCTSCHNPRGGRCFEKLCRKCCRAKMLDEKSNCTGHGFYYSQKLSAAKVINQTSAEDESAKGGEELNVAGSSSELR